MTASLAPSAALPTGRLLHAQGDWWSGDALDGPRPHPTERPALLEADRRGHHALPLGHEPRRGPTDPQPLQVHVALGVRVRGLAARVGRVCAQATGGERAEPAAYPRRPRGLLGSRHPAHQHALPKGEAARSACECMLDCAPHSCPPRSPHRTGTRSRTTRGGVCVPSSRSSRSCDKTPFGGRISGTMASYGI